MAQNMVDFSVKGVALDEESQLPVVILKNSEKENYLPLVIGPFEASAIIVEIEGVHPPRPMTHDLFREMFKRHRFQMVSVEIYDLVEDEYLARIRYRAGLALHTMEVRPSDGIAIALRMNAPIRVSEEVIGTASSEILEPGSEDRVFLYLDRPSSGVQFM